MKEKFIEKTKVELERFAWQVFNDNYHVYSVTLTYADEIRNKFDRKYYPVELPEQKEAINVDMDNFKDAFNKAMKKRNIVFKCFFIYSKHKGKKQNKKQNKKQVERPHFHGFIAVSKAVKMNVAINKRWQKAKITHSPKIWDEEQLTWWIEYCKKNIDKSKDNYLPNYQIKSVTRNSGETEHKSNGFK